MKLVSPSRAFGPTQKDIAEALGLSQSSVALALNPKHQHKLLPDTVALIKLKAKEMGYKPQQFARMLREGRSRIIGVIYSTGLYHAPQERVKHLARSTMECGYQLIAIDLDWFLWDSNRALDYLLGYSPEGVILCNLPDLPLDWRKELSKHGIPSLFLTSALRHHQNDISADIENAFEMLTRHHLSLGSRKITLFLPFYDIGFVGWPGTSIVNRARGFSKVIAEAGGTVKADPTIAEHLQLPAKKRGKNNAIAATILRPPKTDDFATAFEMGGYFANRMIHDREIPDSLVCSNDEIACGAVNAFVRAGVRIPEVVRISGADNSPFAATCCVPLTSIEQPTKRITREAIARIIDLIEKPGEPLIDTTQSFPCTLVQRESTLGSLPPL